MLYGLHCPGSSIIECHQQQTFDQLISSLYPTERFDGNIDRVIEISQLLLDKPRWRGCNCQWANYLNAAIHSCIWYTWLKFQPLNNITSLAVNLDICLVAPVWQPVISQTTKCTWKCLLQGPKTNPFPFHATCMINSSICVSLLSVTMLLPIFLL